MLLVGPYYDRLSMPFRKVFMMYLFHFVREEIRHIFSVLKSNSRTNSILICAKVKIRRIGSVLIMNYP